MVKQDWNAVAPGSITTQDAFKAHVAQIQAHENYRKPLAFGLCHGYGENSEFVLVNWKENFGSAAVMMNLAGFLGETLIDQRPTIANNITKATLEEIYAVFAPYHAEATGDKHLNVQALRRLVDDPEIRQVRLVVMFRDVPDNNADGAALKNAAIAAGKIAADGTPVAKPAVH